MTTENKNLSTSTAIIIAAIIIALGLFFGLQDFDLTSKAGKELTTEKISETIKITASRSQELETKVTVDEHIIGNFEKAEIFVIEYADLECPFCKRFHDGEKAEALKTFADNEKVAFVFRHFPLGRPLTAGDLHPTAVEEAVISECVATLAGEEKFQEFVNQIFAETASDGRYDLPLLLTQAEGLGVKKKTLIECYQGAEAGEKVAKQFQQGVLMGVQGTPTIFIQTKTGETSLLDRQKNENLIDKINSYF